MFRVPAEVVQLGFIVYHGVFEFFAGYLLVLLFMLLASARNAFFFGRLLGVCGYF